MRKPNDIHERRVFEIMSKHVKHSKWMFKNPYETLLTYRSLNKPYVFVQPPYRTKLNFDSWSDLALFDPNKGIDIRIEVMSLHPKSVLAERTYKPVRESKNMPEELLILILLGNGFDEYATYGIRDMIRSERLPVTIMRSIEEFEFYLKRMYENPNE